MRKILFIILVSFVFSSCDQFGILPEDVSPYNGSWTIAFSNSMNNVMREGVIAVKDDGKFCSKISTETGDSVYVTGNITSGGLIRGNFTPVCGGTTSGYFSGNFNTVLGILTGKGDWSDMEGSITVSGRWNARRN
jgi:hypothetical protein